MRSSSSLLVLPHYQNYLDSDNFHPHRIRILNHAATYVVIERSCEKWERNKMNFSEIESKRAESKRSHPADLTSAPLSQYEISRNSCRQIFSFSKVLKWTKNLQNFWQHTFLIVWQLNIDRYGFLQPNIIKWTTPIKQPRFENLLKFLPILHTNISSSDSDLAPRL